MALFLNVPINSVITSGLIFGSIFLKAASRVKDYVDPVLLASAILYILIGFMFLLFSSFFTYSMTLSYLVLGDIVSIPGIIFCISAELSIGIEFYEVIYDMSSSIKFLTTTNPSRSTFKL